MTDVARLQQSALEQLGPDALYRLAHSLRAAGRRARSRGVTVLVSVTTPAARYPDPAAAVITSRLAEEPWFALEQPDRDGLAIAGLGCVQRIEADGAERFTEVSQRWQELRADAQIDGLDGPPGSGLAAFGGFAFAAEGGASPEWHGYAPGSMIVPEVSVVRQSGASWLTVNAQVAPDDTPDDVTARMAAAAAIAAPRPSARCLTPIPPVATRWRARCRRPTTRRRWPARSSGSAPGSSRRSCWPARSTSMRPRRTIPAPSSACCARRLTAPSSTPWVAATRRSSAPAPSCSSAVEGQRATTVALAGSARRSADPAVDDHLGEQLMGSDKDREENAIVGRRIARTLRPFSVWVTAAPEPVVVKVANIQHLAAPIRAQLAAPIDAIELVGHLHPTPAVGAEPAGALGVIPALEGFDRGWYAGAVGWTDASGDGEFWWRCAVRCCAGRWRAATPAAASCATQTRRPSWPRPRSSCR